jgi:small subunit ribosomal protein S2
MATTVNVKSLLDAAVHFGHQTRRWNPKMKPYIFTDRNGIYIIDLKRTLVELDQAYSFVSKLAARGGKLLFVGTKKQAQEPIQRAAERCGMPYVNNRWLGGMLTNFVTIRSRVTRMEQLETMETDGRMSTLPKKEQISLRRELEKLQANLNGVRNMTEVPQAVFVVDTNREQIAIREAQRLGVQVIGIIDTNSDPDEVDFGIPGNDDAISAVSLISDLIADAVLAGSVGAVVSEAEMVLGEADAASAAGGSSAAVAAALPTVAASEPPVAVESASEPLADAFANEPPLAVDSPVAEPAAVSPDLESAPAANPDPESAPESAPATTDESAPEPPTATTTDEPVAPETAPEPVSGA